jgi:hypothetical protein
MGKRSNPRAEHLRMALAQEAARIMSEQGIDDYGLAKRKAAERLGATDIAVLPKNTEIEAALAAHHRLFEGKKHSTALSALRRTALQAMQLLKNFQPRLVGPVLTGTASAHSEVNLHLFAEGPEPVALHLMERGIPHHIAERRLRYEPNRLVSYPVVQPGGRQADAPGGRGGAGIATTRKRLAVGGWSLAKQSHRSAHQPPTAMRQPRS